MRDFRVERLAQVEFDEAAGWYEQQRVDLGTEFVAEVERVLLRIEMQEKFVTSPIAILDRGVVRRESVHRFPYVVIFVEPDATRRDHDPSWQRQPGIVEAADLASVIQTHGSSSAADADYQNGTSAYATDSAVVVREAPDLHTD